MKTFKQFLEAVGDPLTSRNVIALDKESQKNLKSTMTPAGPPPMSQQQKSPKKPSNNRFLNRMIGSTMYTPL